MENRIEYITIIRNEEINKITVFVKAKPYDAKIKNVLNLSEKGVRELKGIEKYYECVKNDHVNNREGKLEGQWIFEYPMPKETFIAYATNDKGQSEVIEIIPLAKKKSKKIK